MLQLTRNVCLLLNWSADFLVAYALILCEDWRVDERTGDPPWLAGFLFVGSILPVRLPLSVDIHDWLYLGFRHPEIAH